jgi:hypothetical protein
MKAFAWFMFGLCVILFVFLSVYCIYQGYVFKLNCGGYLKLAADAPTIERAGDFLSRALGYIEKTGKTSGNSAVIFKTPENDVGLWYGQLLAAKMTTDKILERGSSATQLEKDNALMKIRETLLDQGEKGTVITRPAHISIVPYQVPIILLWWVLLALSGACVFCMFKAYE